MSRILFTRLYVFLMLSMCLVCAMQLFAQEPSLAEQIFQKYQALLQRSDVQEELPIVLIELKKPEHQQFLRPATINAVLDDPDTLKTLIPDTSDDFITLLKEDTDIRTMLRDPDVQMLLQDPEAIDELASLLEIEASVLAPLIFDRYQLLFQREDIRELLPDVLTILKHPDTQALLQPATIQLVAEDPDLLKTIVPEIEDRFITLLKEDADVKVFINDPDVHTLLQNPIEIDALAQLLSVESPLIVVSIVPASIESPGIGEQFSITVDIANAQNVAGYQVSLQFDSEALQYISWEQGTYLSGDIFVIPTVIKENQVSFASTAGTMATETEGSLLTITFKAIAIKASTLTLTEVILSSLAGVALPVTTEDGEIVEPPTPPWDVNKDGVINILDLTLVASHFGETGVTPADVNGDNVVNILDLTLVASHFGE
ncbi:MAG: cohesin domain-containing protein [Candidatus Poribacteria bacterium]|nr:cohesin domain-containing protein [Candidatus Poribacteria bacterium]